MKPTLFCLLMLALLSVPAISHAGTITGTEISPTEWEYNLVFAPEDNFSITQPDTTITLTGLYGVTSAAGPTSTTFPSSYINGINLDWSAQVLDGGTEVVWTHVGPGTGNFSVQEEDEGFEVFATGAVNGTVSFATSGLSTDEPDPVNRDSSGSVAGPVAPEAAAVPEPSSVSLIALGSGVLLLARRRRTR